MDEARTEEFLRMDGIVERVLFENQETDYAVFEVNAAGESYTAAGNAHEVKAGESVILYGWFEEHRTYGRQFHVERCENSMPKDLKDTLAFLSGGALPYIGPATAKKIVERFGADCLEVIAHDPLRLTELQGITPEKANAISREFERMFGVQEAVAYLGRFGVTMAQAVEAFRRFGKDTLEEIGRNPYILCAEPLHISFRIADKIAGELQFDTESSLRLREGLLYVMRHNITRNQHTCLPREALVETAAPFLSIDRERANDELDRMLADGEAESFEEEEGEFIYLPDLWNVENDIADRLLELSRRPAARHADVDRNICVLEQAQGFSYAPEQRQAIHMALENSAMVLTGGPGTGKTTTVNAILALLLDERKQVALCAPTGRAAKRLSELTGQKAQTIHRLLEVDYDPQTRISRFIHNEKNLLPCDVVVLDEMSMVDAKLFRDLLAALRRNCCVIMVGDADQLPSVGAGNLLREILRSEVVPTVRLEKVFRQGERSLIAENARRIAEGKNPRKATREDDFFLLTEDSPDINDRKLSFQQLVCELVSPRLPACYGFDPVRDIQVICPGKSGAVGKEELNLVLQAQLNPPAAGKGEITFSNTKKVFREGDKVMQVRNNYTLPYERDGGEQGMGVFNGDMGIVLKVDPATRSVLVQMDDRKVTYGPESLSELEIAYAITAHKSQGSEFPAVIIPVSGVREKLRRRSVLYTAVTRARQLCVVTGEAKLIKEMLKNAQQEKRFSCLGGLLRRKAQQ